MGYVLDANVFIEAYQRYYAFDLVPGFWDLLINLAKQGYILSIDRVKRELEQRQDALAQWAQNEFEPYFMTTNDGGVLQEYGHLIQWAVKHNNRFRQSAINEFAQDNKADAWVIAYAKAYGHIVVTEEKYDPNARKKIPIPVACKDFNVPYTNTFDMLRSLRIRFTIDKQ